MFFRFISAIVLVVVVSMAGIVIEKHSLDLRRDISRQQYQTEILLEEHTRLRLKTQALSAPDRLLETMDDELSTWQPEQSPGPAAAAALDAPPPGWPGLPLMNWERPVRRSDPPERSVR